MGRIEMEMRKSGQGRDQWTEEEFSRVIGNWRSSEEKKD